MKRYNPKILAEIHSRIKLVGYKAILHREGYVEGEWSFILDEKRIKFKCQVLATTEADQNREARNRFAKQVYINEGNELIES